MKKKELKGKILLLKSHNVDLQLKNQELQDKLKSDEELYFGLLDRHDRVVNENEKLRADRSTDTLFNGLNRITHSCANISPLLSQSSIINMMNEDEKELYLKIRHIKSNLETDTFVDL